MSKKQTLKNDEKFQDFVKSKERQYNIAPGLLNTIFEMESNFNPNAKSPVGARGIAQFMPGTAKQYGVDVTDPYSSAEGAAKYLSDLNKMFKGDTDKVLASYNWGQGNVQRKGLDYAPAETRNYLSKAKKLMGQNYKSSYDYSSEEAQAMPVQQGQVEANPIEPMQQPMQQPMQEPMQQPMQQQGMLPELQLPPLQYQRPEDLDYMRNRNMATATANSMMMYQPSINPSQAISQLNPQDQAQAQAVQGVQIPNNQQPAMEQPMQGEAMPNNDVMAEMLATANEAENNTQNNDTMAEMLAIANEYEAENKVKVSNEPKPLDLQAELNTVKKIANGKNGQEKSLEHLYNLKKNNPSDYKLVVGAISKELNKDKKGGFFNDTKNAVKSYWGGLGRGVFDATQGIKQFSQNLTGLGDAEKTQKLIDYEEIRRDLVDEGRGGVEKGLSTVGNVVGQVASEAGMLAATAPLGAGLAASKAIAKGAGAIGQLVNKSEKAAKVVKAAKEIADKGSKLTKNSKVASVASTAGKGAAVGVGSTAFETVTSDDIKKYGSYSEALKNKAATNAALGAGAGVAVKGAGEFLKRNKVKTEGGFISKGDKELEKAAKENNIPLSAIDFNSKTVEDLREAYPDVSEAKLRKLVEDFNKKEKQVQKQFERTKTSDNNTYSVGEKIQKEAIDKAILKNLDKPDDRSNPLTVAYKQMTKIKGGNTAREIEKEQLAKEFIKLKKDGGKDNVAILKLTSEAHLLENKIKSDELYDKVKKLTPKEKIRIDDKNLIKVAEEFRNEKSISPSFNQDLNIFEEYMKNFSTRNGETTSVSDYSRFVSDLNNKARELKSDSKPEIAMYYTKAAEALNRDIENTINSFNKPEYVNFREAWKEAQKFNKEKIQKLNNSKVRDFFYDLKKNGKETGENNLLNKILSNRDVREDFIKHSSPEVLEVLNRTIKQDIKNKVVASDGEIDYNKFIKLLNKKEDGADIQSLRDVIGKEDFKKLNDLATVLSNVKQIKSKFGEQNQASKGFDIQKSDTSKEGAINFITAPILRWISKGLNNVRDRKVINSFDDPELSRRLRKIEQFDVNSILYQKHANEIAAYVATKYNEKRD